MTLEIKTIINDDDVYNKWVKGETNIRFKLKPTKFKCFLNWLFTPMSPLMGGVTITQKEIDDYLHNKLL